jgi:hypothetical protein
MNSHTSWYPADDPSQEVQLQQAAQIYYQQLNGQERVEEQRFNVPNLPFRLVTSTGGAPYPLHEEDVTAEQSHMVDLISGERFNRTESVRQPVVEDFLHPQHSRPLPSPKIYESDQYMDVIEPIEEHEEDQHLPIIEPDSYFPTDHADTYFPSRPHTAGAVDLGRRDTIASTKPTGLHLDTRRPDPKRSKSAADVLETTDSEHGEVPAMGADMFSPALGGLHRLPSAPLKRPSRLGRIKRFFSLKGRRPYGKASR